MSEGNKQVKSELGCKDEQRGPTNDRFTRLEETVEQLKKENEEIRKGNEEIKSRVAQLQTENLQMNGKINFLLRKYRLSQNQFLEKSSKCTQLERENCKLRSYCKRLLKKCKLLGEGALQELHIRFNRLNINYTQLMTVYTQLQVDHSEVEEENTILIEDYEAQKERCRELERQVRVLGGIPAPNRPTVRMNGQITSN